MKNFTQFHVHTCCLRSSASPFKRRLDQPLLCPLTRRYYFILRHPRHPTWHTVVLKLNYKVNQITYLQISKMDQRGTFHCDSWGVEVQRVHLWAPSSHGIPHWTRPATVHSSTAIRTKQILYACRLCVGWAVGPILSHLSPSSAQKPIACRVSFGTLRLSNI